MAPTHQTSLADQASDALARDAALTGPQFGMDARRKLGGLAAWLGFTLPSAVELVLFAYGVECCDLADAP